MTATQTHGAKIFYNLCAHSVSATYFIKNISNKWHSGAFAKRYWWPICGWRHVAIIIVIGAKPKCVRSRVGIPHAPLAPRLYILLFIRFRPYANTQSHTHSTGRNDKYFNREHNSRSTFVATDAIRGHDVRRIYIWVGEVLKGWIQGQMIYYQLAISYLIYDFSWQTVNVVFSILHIHDKH